MKIKKILSGVLALIIVFTTIISANIFIKAEETHQVKVVTWDKKNKKNEDTVGELKFTIKVGYPLKKVGEFTSKDGIAQMPKLEDGVYSIVLEENDYYQANDIFLTVENGEYSFDGEDDEDTITVEKKKGVVIPTPNPSNPEDEISKALLVTDEKGSSIKDVSFEVISDGKTKVVKPDNNSAINFGVEENKTYTIKLISNDKYEMEDVTFTCIKGVSDFGTPIYRLMNGNNEITSLLLKNKEVQPPVQPVEKEFTFDVLCGSCGKTPIAKELSFEVTGNNFKEVYKSNSGIVKFTLVENEKYTVKLLEDSDYSLKDIEITVKKSESGELICLNNGKNFTEFVMQKKSTSGNCVDTLCNFSDNKIKMSEIPIKVLEDGIERDLKTDEVVIFNLYNATKQERVGEVRTVNGKLPALEVFEKDDYILFTSKENKKFKMADAPFLKEVSELYFMPNGEGKLPIRHKTKNPYATGANLNINRIVVVPLKNYDKISETYTIDYVRIKQDKNNPQDYSKVKVIFTSEYNTVVATTLPEDNWGVPLTPLELYENVQYSVRVEDPENKFAIENFPFTLVDKSERGPKHPKGWGDGKYVFDHSFCGNATFLTLVKKGTENDHNTSVTCSNGNTTITGMNFKDLMLKTIRPKYSVKELEGKDFDLFRFKLINPKRCEVSKMADGDFTIHRTVKDGKIAKNAYQVNKDGSLTKLDFTQKGNVVDIKTKTLSIYDTILEYEKVEVNRNITGEKLLEMQKEGAVIVDVRVENQYNEGHIKGAINLPLQKIQNEISKQVPQKDTKIVLYCNSGNQSGQALKILLSMGYTNVYNAQGVREYDYKLVKTEKSNEVNKAEVNKAELKKAIEKAKLSETIKNKTEESIKVMKELLIKAEEIFADKNATQEKVDEITKTLIKAIIDLKEKEEILEKEIELKNEDGTIVVKGTDKVLNRDSKLTIIKATSELLKDKKYDAFDIKILDKNGNEVQPNGEVTVIIKSKGNVKNVYHITDVLNPVDFKEDKDGNIVFKTNHFSVYALVYGDKVDDNTKPKDDVKTNIPKTSVSGGMYYAVSSILTLGGAIVISKKRKNR